MKIAIAPDIHLNKAVFKGVYDRQYPTVPFRSADFMRAFEWCVDKCINELKPDIFVIPGDIYDNPSPSNKVRGFFSKQLRKLNSNKIPVLILIGIHDVYMTNHALKDIKELGLKSIKIVEDPKILDYKGAHLFLLPYSIEVEQGKVTMKEEFEKFLVKIKEKDDGVPSIFFGHFSVQGAKMNEYADPLQIAKGMTKSEADKKDRLNKNKDDISVSDLDRIGSDYVFLGDFHEFQILKTKNCVALYGGTLEKSDFSEISQKKGFVFYDSDATEEGHLKKCRFIENPNCRPIIELEGNFNKIRDQFNDLDLSKHQEAMVKIKFKGTYNESLIFSSNLDSFKRNIIEKVNPIYFDSTQDVEKKEMKEEADKLEEEIKDTGHLSGDNIMPIVAEALAERVEDEEEMKFMVALGTEIYNEVTKGLI